MELLIGSLTIIRSVLEKTAIFIIKQL